MLKLSSREACRVRIKLDGISIPEILLQFLLSSEAILPKPLTQIMGSGAWVLANTYRASMSAAGNLGPDHLYAR